MWKTRMDIWSDIWNEFFMEDCVTLLSILVDFNNNDLNSSCHLFSWLFRTFPKTSIHVLRQGPSILFYFLLSFTFTRYHGIVCSLPLVMTGAKIIYHPMSLVEPWKMANPNLIQRWTHTTGLGNALSSWCFLA